MEFFLQALILIPLNLPAAFDVPVDEGPHALQACGFRRGADVVFKVGHMPAVEHRHQVALYDVSEAVVRREIENDACSCNGGSLGGKYVVEADLDLKR